MREKKKSKTKEWQIYNTNMFSKTTKSFKNKVNDQFTVSLLKKRSNNLIINNIFIN